MEDAQIIELYWVRSETAIAETAGKYGGFLHSIAWNILRSQGDAEECVNDTYLRTWNAIPPARPSAFRAWLGRIVRNLSLDRWKEARTQKRGGERRDRNSRAVTEKTPKAKLDAMGVEHADPHDARKRAQRCKKCAQVGADDGSIESRNMGLAGKSGYNTREQYAHGNVVDEVCCKKRGKPIALHRGQTVEHVADAAGEAVFIQRQH